MKYLNNKDDRRIGFMVNEIQLTMLFTLNFCIKTYIKCYHHIIKMV